MGKRTTIGEISKMADALAAAQGSPIVITLADVQAHMAWIKNPDQPPPITAGQAKFIMQAMNFLLSENVPSA
jgi:hypothetical protein